ncbi:MAG: plastocyanin/azurin family copper-binding protein [Candidatus Paceibacteria bacterium]
MNSKILGIIFAIIVIAGGWYFLSATPAKAPTTVTPTTQTPSTTTATVPTQTTTTTTTKTTTGVMVIYGAQGFSPANVTVPVGTKVTFINQNGDEMWIASDPHPTHQGYDGTTKDQHCAVGYTGATPFDECAAGGRGTSYSFTFTKVGTWGYHNHGAASDKGTVTVTAK